MEPLIVTNPFAFGRFGEVFSKLHLFALQKSSLEKASQKLFNANGFVTIGVSILTPLVVFWSKWKPQLSYFGPQVSMFGGTRSIHRIRGAIFYPRWSRMVPKWPQMIANMTQGFDVWRDRFHTSNWGCNIFTWISSELYIHINRTFIRIRIVIFSAARRLSKEFQKQLLILNDCQSLLCIQQLSGPVWITLGHFQFPCSYFYFPCDESG